MDFPRALGITLYDHIDPEALDRPVSTTGDASGVSVDLTVHNDYQYAVEIRNTGHLVVEKIG
ncbi:HalOD1 output domain-containing protein [Haloprofundus salilacus]|uniref:HalOD1 output domain-containing protein n=1 Tax=Haloprofundus salilacus TaxID=2876190 RepID=UPI003CCD8D0C